MTRFIPTHVGNRGDAHSRPTGWPVHPHARGEQVSDAIRQEAFCTVHPHARGEQLGNTVSGDGKRGSSPRTWGTVDALGVHDDVDRFIPTHVGNRAVPQLPAMAVPVHPHARGEQLHALLTVLIFAGSSPRTWGTGLHGQCPAHQGRFIPTHVGNRLHSRTDSLPSPVHPHARGEQNDLLSMPFQMVGSSPRTWGTVT